MALCVSCGAFEVEYEDVCCFCKTEADFDDSLIIDHFPTPYTIDYKILKFIRKLKSAPCTDCKVSYPYYVMDFDHVRGIKSFNICGAHFNRTTKEVQAELLKCDLVCSNCHRERTHGRLDKGL